MEMNSEDLKAFNKLIEHFFEKNVLNPIKIVVKEMKEEMVEYPESADIIKGEVKKLIDTLQEVIHMKI